MSQEPIIADDATHGTSLASYKEFFLEEIENTWFPCLQDDPDDNEPTLYYLNPVNVVWMRREGEVVAAYDVKGMRHRIDLKE